MASDQDIAKKEAELGDLLPFLDARADAIGSSLHLAAVSENPDFICTAADGTLVGVELARITNGPIEAHWSAILDERRELDPYEALELISHLLGRKEKARAERYSQAVQQCILVLCLSELPLESLAFHLERLESDFRDHGFVEIWLADYAELDAFGTVNLYGLYPAEIWGLHSRWNSDTKPFG